MYKCNFIADSNCCLLWFRFHIPTNLHHFVSLTLESHDYKRLSNWGWIQRTTLNSKFRHSECTHSKYRDISHTVRVVCQHVHGPQLLSVCLCSSYSHLLSRIHTAHLLAQILSHILHVSISPPPPWTLTLHPLHSHKYKRPSANVIVSLIMHLIQL